MNIPENCKDCVFLKLLYKDKHEQFPVCMLEHSLLLASGCINKKQSNY